MSRRIALILSCMIVMTGANAVYGAEYADVKQGHWAYEAVNAMSDRSIIKGYPNGSFHPDNTITYGEFIKMAVIAGTGQDVGNAASGHWASNYYDTALELKYFNSKDINKAYLQNRIPRGDMALIISSILGETVIEDYDELQKEIKDVNYKTKHEYDITKSYAAGILTGYPDQTFRPDQTLSRAESAAVIHRLVDETKRKLPDVEEKDDANLAVSLDHGWKSYDATLHDVKLGDNGIEKIFINSISGRVVIYSTIYYNDIALYIDNIYVDGMTFTSGLNYYTENGYYVYLANPKRKNILVTGKTPSLLFVTDSFTSVKDIYRYTDVIL